MAIDVSPAFDLMQTVAVSYYVRLSAFPAVYQSSAQVAVFQVIASQAEAAPSGGFYEQLRCSFKIKLADLSASSITPALGDKVTDAAGFDWIVVDSHKGLASWSVGAVRFVVGKDEVDWRQVNQQTNVFGDRITDPATFPLGGHFVCRVQPADNSILDLFGKRGAVQHYIVYLLSDQQFTFGDLLIETTNANRKFVIRDWRSREDIQNAMLILCEVLP